MTLKLFECLVLFKGEVQSPLNITKQSSGNNSDVTS